MGATDAVDVLTNSTYTSYTHIGDANDATSLENMKNAIQYIRESNTLRRKEGTSPVDGQPLGELMVSDYLMAAAQAEANYSMVTNNHARQFNIGENIAWGYQDPFRGWYDFEKAKYDKGIRDMGVIGHYINLTDSSFYSSGFAVLSGGEYGSQHLQTFYFADANAMPVDQYEARFLEYYNLVKNGGGSSGTSSSRIDQLYADLQQAQNEKSNLETQYHVAKYKRSEEQNTQLNSQLSMINSERDSISQQISAIEADYQNKKEAVDQEQKKIDTLNSELQALEKEEKGIQEKIKAVQKTEDVETDKETEKSSEETTKNAEQELLEKGASASAQNIAPAIRKGLFLEEEEENRESKWERFYHKWKYLILVEGSLFLAAMAGLIFWGIKRKKKKDHSVVEKKDKMD